MFKSSVIRRMVVMLLAIAMLMTIVPSAFASTNPEGVTLEQDDAEGQQEFTISHESDCTDIIYEPFVQSIIHDASKGIADLQEAILEKKEYTEGLSNKLEIDNVDSFKSAIELKYPEMTDVELGKTILLALGDEEEFISKLPEEKVIEAMQYTSVVRTESYYKETVDGNRIEMSKAEFYADLNDNSAQKNVNTSIGSAESTTLSTDAAKASGIHDDEETFEDGYLKIISTAYKYEPDYAVTGRNYFVIRGEAQWLKEPYYKRKDILAIASSGNYDDRYTATAIAYWPGSNPGPITDIAEIGKNGGHGTFYLGEALYIYPPSIYGVAVDVIVGFQETNLCLDYVCAYYGINTDEDVTCQVGYAHSQIGLSEPSVSIDQGGTVSFSVSIVQKMEDYMGTPFTLYHESYSVLLGTPLNDVSFSCSAQPPIFTWSLQYGYTEKFILEIDYSGTGSYMAIAVDGRTNYALASAQWNTIINDSPFAGTEKIIRWRIKIDYKIYTNETYYSNWSDFIITGVPVISQETLSIPTNTRYQEKLINLGTGGYIDYHITFATDGIKLFQTFGGKDTKMDMYCGGTKVASSDDEGYGLNALIRYSVTANTEYVLRIRLYNSSDYGSTKLAITPAYGALNTGVSLLNKFEDIYAFKNVESTSFSTFAETNYTRVLTFTPPSSGSYTFTINSSFDTYIYIIDPQSSNAIPYTNYDDDHGEGMNPMLTIALTANVPYVIIYSAYNPSRLTERTGLSVLISKN